MVKQYRKIFQFLLILIIFVFLLYGFFRNISKIPFDKIHFNIFLVLISYLFLTTHFIIYIFSWKAIMRALKVDIVFLKSFWMIAISQIAKYIPGGIWFAAGRMYLAKKERISGDKTAIGLIIETALIFIAGIILLFIILLISNFFPGLNLPLFIFLLVASLLLLHPKVLVFFTNVVLRIFKRAAIEVEMSYFDIAKLSVYFFGFWIIQISGFYFLINSIYVLPIQKIFIVSGIYILSWMSGFLVIISPGGIGVREGIMSLLLSSIIPLPLAIAISLLYRIWITIFEILMFFIGYYIMSRLHIENESTSTPFAK